MIESKRERKRENKKKEEILKLQYCIEICFQFNKLYIHISHAKRIAKLLFI